MSAYVQLGKMRMMTPCRGSLCDHLQCFDALTFLRMNEQKSSWTCPVCDQSVEYDQLIIDGSVIGKKFLISNSVLPKFSVGGFTWHHNTLQYCLSSPDQSK